MTFSLRPRRSSLQAATAASVRTRVVSWNDAAEMNDSVASDALVIPSSTGSIVSGSLPCASSVLGDLEEPCLVDLLAAQVDTFARRRDVHLAQASGE